MELGTLLSSTRKTPRRMESLLKLPLGKRTTSVRCVNIGRIGLSVQRLRVRTLLVSTRLGMRMNWNLVNGILLVTRTPRNLLRKCRRLVRGLPRALGFTRVWNGNLVDPLVGRRRTKTRKLAFRTFVLRNWLRSTPKKLALRRNSRRPLREVLLLRFRRKTNTAFTASIRTMRKSTRMPLGRNPWEPPFLCWMV